MRRVVPRGSASSMGLAWNSSQGPWMGAGKVGVRQRLMKPRAGSLGSGLGAFAVKMRGSAAVKVVSDSTIALPAGLWPVTIRRAGGRGAAITISVFFSGFE